MYTQVNQYHVILEAEPRVPAQTRSTLDKLYIQANASAARDGDGRSDLVRVVGIRLPPARTR